MKKFIQNKLRENIKISENMDKFAELEIDIEALIQKYKDKFAEYPGDTYGVIDAINQVFNSMFQRI